MGALVTQIESVGWNVIQLACCNMGSEISWEMDARMRWDIGAVISLSDRKVVI